MFEAPMGYGLTNFGRKRTNRLTDFVSGLGDSFG